MFILKKIISSFFTIPGIFIFILISLGLHGIKKRNGALKINILIGLILYCVSIYPFANTVIGFVEKDCRYSGEEKIDSIILLGGGVVDGVYDLTGESAPSPYMLSRVIDAVRLYKKYRVPIIVSGGSTGNGATEASVVNRFLVDLGVKERDVIQEDSSRDTVENAEFVKAIFTEKGFKKGLLLTSAFHIRRSEFIFNKTGIDVIPYSSGYLSDKKNSLNIHDFLPQITELTKTAFSIKEMIGIAFYYIKYIFPA